MKELKEYVVKKPNIQKRAIISTPIPQDINDYLVKQNINISATFRNFLIDLVEELKNEEDK